MTAKKPRTPVEKAQDEQDLDAWQKLQALGSGLQVLVRRQPGGKYLEIVALDGLDEEVMRERYGGGKFTLHPRKDGSYIKGKGQIQHIDIEGLPIMFPPAGVDATNPEIIRLNAQIEKLTDSGGDGPSENMIMAVTALFGPVLAAIATSLLDRPAPPPPPDPIEMFNVLRKMTKDDREYIKSNSDSSGMDPLVEKLGIPLLGEITKLREQAATNGATPATPGATPAAATHALPAAKPTTLPELAAFVARWCAPHCSRGTSPTLRAELFLEELSLQDPDLMDSVIELSRVPDVLTHWERLVPEVALNKDWHGAFIEEIRVLADLADEAQPAAPGEAGADQGTEDPEGGRGNEGDPSGDGATVPAGLAE